MSVNFLILEKELPGFKLEKGRLKLKGGGLEIYYKSGTVRWKSDRDLKCRLPLDGLDNETVLMLTKKFMEIQNND